MSQKHCANRTGTEPPGRKHAAHINLAKCRLLIVFPRNPRDGIGFMPLLGGGEVFYPKLSETLWAGNWTMAAITAVSSASLSSFTLSAMLELRISEGLREYSPF